MYVQASYMSPWQNKLVVLVRRHMPTAGPGACQRAIPPTHKRTSPEQPAAPAVGAEDQEEGEGEGRQSEGGHEGGMVGDVRPAMGLHPAIASTHSNSAATLAELSADCQGCMQCLGRVPRQALEQGSARLAAAKAPFVTAHGPAYLQLCSIDSTEGGHSGHPEHYWAQAL